MRHKRSIGTLMLAMLTTPGCRHASVADDVANGQTEDLTEPPTAAAVPLALAAPTATGQISFVGLLARSGVAGVHMALAPLVRQARDYTSGAAALEAVLAYWGDAFREGQLAQLLPAKPTGDVSFDGLVAFVNSLNDPKQRSTLLATTVTDEAPGSAGDVHRWPKSAAPASPYKVDVFPGKDKSLRRLQDTGEVGVPKDGITMAELQHHVDHGWPVIIPLQAWSAAAKPKYDDNTDGHYAVVVGYDKTNWYLMDPATTGNYTYIPKEELSKRWHTVEGKALMRRSGIVIHRDRPAFDFDNVTKLE